MNRLGPKTGGSISERGQFAGLTGGTYDGIADGMKAMVHRTTFALDEATVRRLRTLSAVWQVSQAEVVRRSVAMAEETARGIRPDPAVLLLALHESGQGLVRDQAEEYLLECRSDRAAWRAGE